MFLWNTIPPKIKIIWTKSVGVLENPEDLAILSGIGFGKLAESAVF